MSNVTKAESWNLEWKCGDIKMSTGSGTNPRMYVSKGENVDDTISFTYKQLTDLITCLEEARSDLKKKNVVL